MSEKLIVIPIPLASELLRKTAEVVNAIVAKISTLLTSWHKSLRGKKAYFTRPPAHLHTLNERIALKDQTVPPR